MSFMTKDVLLSEAKGKVYAANYEISGIAINGIRKEILLKLEVHNLDTKY